MKPFNTDKMLVYQKNITHCLYIYMYTRIAQNLMPINWLAKQNTIR